MNTITAPMTFPYFDSALHADAKDLAVRLQLRGEPASGEVCLTLARAYLDLLERRGLPPTLKCHPSIQLVSGVYFDFLDPENSPLPIEDIAHALSRIARCNGHTLGSLALSVAQHCVLASHMAPPGFKFEALMHDTAESVTGDMTTPLKQLLPDFQIIEHRCENAIRDRYLLPRKLSREAKLVDIRLAATEKRDVMPVDPDHHRWAIPEGIHPYDFKITPWTPENARKAFLERFNDLWPEHQRKHAA